MIQAIGARWRIEEDLEATKALGLGHYETRSFVGWYRHLTLVLLAYAFLVSICVQQQEACGAPGEDKSSRPSLPLIPLTPSEVGHVLARLFFPAPTSAPLICQWSWWRRTHQYWAGYYHRIIAAVAKKPTHPASCACLSFSTWFQAIFQEFSLDRPWHGFKEYSRQGRERRPRSCSTAQRKGVVS